MQRYQRLEQQSWRLTALLSITCLSGCMNPQAQPGDEVAATCHGQQWSQCFRQVDKRCGSGRYQLLSQITDEGSSTTGNNDSLIHGTFVQRTLVVRCTDGKGSNKK